MFYNSNIVMKNLSGHSVDKFAKDTTGKITYTFDSYGFRKLNNYSIKPNYAFFGSSTVFGVGVQDNEVFTKQFDKCWNFGCAGKYTETEIVDNVKKFMALKLDTKIVMLWRDNSYIEYVKDLDKNILHCIPHRKDNFMRLLDNIDYDVSNTHWGPKTHYKFSKLLKAKLS